MKRFSFILLYVLLLTGGLSCSKDHLLDAFKSTGPETSQTRLLPPFTSIKVGGKFDVILIQDSSAHEQVQITAGSHIIDGITTEVSDGNLFIKNSNKVNWVRKLKTRFKVVVTLKSIDKLDIEGAAKVVRTAPGARCLEMPFGNGALDENAVAELEDRKGSRDHQ